MLYNIRYNILHTRTIICKCMKFTGVLLFAMYSVESVKVNLIFNIANTCMYSNLSFLNLLILQNTFQPGYTAATCYYDLYEAIFLFGYQS